MSLLNVFVSDDLAIVAVDSLRIVTLPGGGYVRPAGHGPKLCYFERTNAVMASRGHARTWMYLRGYLGDGQQVASFDAIDDAIPKAFELAQQRVQQELCEASGAYVDGQTVRLVGYSERLHKVVAIAFDQASPGQALVREIIEQDTELAPWHDVQGDLPAGDSVETMREIAFQQIDFQRQIDGDRATVGGYVVIAEVHRHVVRIHRFPTGGHQTTG